MNRAATVNQPPRAVSSPVHVKDQLLTPAQVTAEVNAYRAAGTSFEDTVPAN
ncbi:hypothetical protein ABT084_07340 [Streptomyces sp. NPDC002138]|uniref:hypothetical protein n=1 Tax=Streptomyces sp. NPDC002138 TaxID=3154410 RepID=UPI00332C44B9